MVTAQRAHHGAAARAVCGDCFAHRIPEMHERHRPCRDIAGALGGRPCRADGAEIEPDAATLLQRDRAFTQRAEQPVDRVVHFAHDKAVEQRRTARRACIGKDTAARQEPETGQEVDEALLPQACIVAFHRRNGPRDTAPGVLDARFAPEPVFPCPDIFGDGRGKGTHVDASPCSKDRVSCS